MRRKGLYYDDNPKHLGIKKKKQSKNGTHVSSVQTFDLEIDREIH